MRRLRHRRLTRLRRPHGSDRLSALTQVSARNVAEFQFRYDNRENADIFGAANTEC